MLGFRGASRYIAPEFHDCFELECAAMKRVRDEMGLTNVELMVPFVRTLNEAEEVIALLAENGLERGKNGLRVIMMCEIPSNAILADRFLEHFDGFSIGSNDMTQLTLGVDRDSGGADRRDVRRARRRGEGDAVDGDRGVPQGRQVRRASAGRARPIIRISRSGWSSRASTACRSIPDTVVETWLLLAKNKVGLKRNTRPLKRRAGSTAVIGLTALHSRFIIAAAGCAMHTRSRRADLVRRADCALFRARRWHGDNALHTALFPWLRRSQSPVLDCRRLALSP